MTILGGDPVGFDPAPTSDVWPLQEFQLRGIAIDPEHADPLPVDDRDGLVQPKCQRDLPVVEPGRRMPDCVEPGPTRDQEVLIEARHSDDGIPGDGDGDGFGGGGGRVHPLSPIRRGIRTAKAIAIMAATPSARRASSTPVSSASAVTIETGHRSAALVNR